MPLDSRIVVFGASGMLGSAIVRNLQARGYTDIHTPSSYDCNLLDVYEVGKWYAEYRPNVVIMAAGRVGGIEANRTRPVNFLGENMEMALNAFLIGAWGKWLPERFCYIGSSCIYPRACPQPMKEEYLGTGAFEPTNEGYAIAKYAGVKLAQMYAQQYGLNTICPLPCNLYGDNDHFELDRAHVLAALVKRFVDAHASGADSVTLWGTGSARREFLHVTDAADAIVHLTEDKTLEPGAVVNVGSGTDVSIRELAQRIAGQVGYTGDIVWDTSKPDGMPQKWLSIDTLDSMGWKPAVELAEGIARTINHYKQRAAQVAGDM